MQRQKRRRRTSSSTSKPPSGLSKAFSSSSMFPSSFVRSREYSPPFSLSFFTKRKKPLLLPLFSLKRSRKRRRKRLPLNLSRTGLNSFRTFHKIPACRSDELRVKLLYSSRTYFCANNKTKNKTRILTLTQCVLLSLSL